jgi:hypothetical protein
MPDAKEKKRHKRKDNGTRLKDRRRLRLGKLRALHLRTQGKILYPNEEPDTCLQIPNHSKRQRAS